MAPSVPERDLISAGGERPLCTFLATLDRLYHQPLRQNCIGRSFKSSITLAKSPGDNVCLSASTPRSSKSAKPHFSADAIDADKEGYVDYPNQLLPLVRPGGLILAHNVDMAPDYVAAVVRNADLDTVFYTQGEGMGVTLKKR